MASNVPEDVNGDFADSYESSIPTSIGPYLIESVISRGLMGSVYRCKPLYPEGKDIAVKILAYSALDESKLSRFHRELEALHRLDHPAVVGVIDFGWSESSAGNRPYIAMEFVDGMRLDEYLRVNNPTVSDRLDLIRKIAEGLQHIHHQGIVHRDLKPSNIMVSGTGDPVIIDFGVAFIEDVAKKIEFQTLTGQIAGTPVYMSPEQMRGAAVDQRSDVYALGIVAYETISGHHPYQLDRVPITQMLEVISSTSPTPLRLHVPEAKGGIEAIVNKAISVQSRDRYTTAAMVGEEIRRFQSGLPVSANTPSIMDRLGRCVRRHPAIASVVSVSIPLMATAMIGFGMYRNAELQRAQNELAIEQSSRLLKLLISDDLDDIPMEHRELYSLLLTRLSQNIDKRGLLPETRAQGRVAIAEGFRMLKDVESLIVLFPKIIEEHLALYGPEDRNTILQHARYAKQLQKTGDSEQANLVFSFVTEHFGSVNDTDLDARVYFAEGEICMGQGRTDEAINAFRQAVEIIATIPDSEHISVQELKVLQMNAMYALSQMYKNQGDYKQSEEQLRELMPFAINRLGENHRYIKLAESDLADLARLQGDVVSDLPP